MNYTANVPSPPCSKLPPDVWSRVLSHLAPDELSTAYPQFFLSSAQQASIDVPEQASRMAVESLIRTAAVYFRTHPPEADPTTQDVHPGLELERFLQTTSLETKTAFGSHKDPTWQEIYEDVHRVIEYLTISGFGKDRSKCVAIAVHSIYLMASSDQSLSG